LTRLGANETMAIDLGVLGVTFGLSGATMFLWFASSWKKNDIFVSLIVWSS